MTVSADPNCGNCGKPLSKHYHEPSDIFCYTNTTGDIFRDEPDEDWVMRQITDRYPELYEAIENEWKRDNGHL